MTALLIACGLFCGILGGAVLTRPKKDWLEIVIELYISFILLYLSALSFQEVFG